MIKIFKRITILLTGAAFVVLALANTQPVPLHAPLFPEVVLELPLYLLFFCALGLGIGLSFVTGIGRSLRQSAAARHSRKDIKKLEAEVALLKVDKKVKEQVSE